MLVKLVKALKTAKKINDELINLYNSKSVECYKSGDEAGHKYWNDRTYAIICQNKQIDEDIRKLKEEAGVNADQN